MELPASGAGGVGAADGPDGARGFLSAEVGDGPHAGAGGLRTAPRRTDTASAGIQNGVEAMVSHQVVDCRVDAGT